MVQLEFLNEENEKLLYKIQRDDVPQHFAEDISYTIALSKYGKENNLKGYCYAIKYKEDYVGIILIGEAIEDEADPVELKGRLFFRIIGFVIDKRYRNLGFGSEVLNEALSGIYSEYGKVPVVLECHKDNKKALEFYSKAGFKNTDILHNQDYYFIK